MISGVAIDQELGRGAFTVVYRGIRAGNRYAVKVLQVADPDAELAFRREAALLASLDDPGLVAIHEIGNAGGRPYLIMDLVDGSSLARFLRETIVPYQRLVDWISQIAGALAVAHRAGLVHRDVKPANIMIGLDDEAKLIDFGLAGRTGADLEAAAVGTFAYSAPEQTGMLRRVVDGRADLYGLGVVLFEGLSGQLPFSASDVGELISLHLTKPAPDLRELRPDLPEALASIVAKLLAKDPDDRYQTGEGLRADLARVAAGNQDAFPLGTAESTVGISDIEVVGRRDELELLLARWREATAGRGGVALITGLPGSGKSRLARELTGTAPVTGRPVWYGRSFRDHTVPFAPLRSALEHHVRTIQALPANDRAAALHRLRTAAGDAGGVLGRVSPALAAALELSGAPAAAPTASALADARATAATGSPSGPSGDDQHQFARAFASFIAALASAERGATLYLDDLQWCDEASRRVLRHLAPLLAGAPLLVVATVRGETDTGIAGVDAERSDAEAPDSERPATEWLVTDLGDAIDCRVALGPLSQVDVASLVVSQLGANTMPESFLARLYARSGGNPLAVQEYTRAMVDAGLIRPAWGTWLVDDDGLRGLALADDVTDLILRRADRLDDDTRQVLTVAAVTGVHFAPALVGEVCGVSEDDVLAAFSIAASRHLIEPAPGGRYGFLHDRIRDALLARIDAEDRKRLHQRVAERMERSGADDSERVYAIAYHYLRGEIDRDPETGYRAMATAGFRALAEHSAAEAFDYFSRAEALAVAAGITPDGEFHIGAGTASARIGQFAGCDHHFGRALAIDQDPLRRARVYTHLADAHQQRWEGERALQMVRNGLAELGQPLPAGQAGILATSAVAFLGGIAIGKLPRRLREITGERRHHWELWAELLNAGAQAAGAANSMPLMLAFNLRALPVANRLGSGWPYLRSKVNLAILAKVVGLHPVCAKLLDLADRAVVPGDPVGAAFVVWARSLVADFVIRTDGRTGETTRACLDRYGRWLAAGDMITSTGIFGVLQIARGYPSDAVQLHRFTLDHTDDADQIHGTTLGIVRPLAAAMLGDPAQAAAGLREVREFLTTIPYNRGQQINVAFAATAFAVEQGETGQVLEDALAEYAGLKVKLAQTWPFQRLFWLYQAFGRLSQVLVVDPEQRAARLEAAADAVAQLGRAANGPFLDAFHRVADASLKQLRGDHEGALRALARCAERSAGLDAPLLQFESARVSARALSGLGRQADARRQVTAALVLAVDGGWQARQRWVYTEFGLDSGDPGVVCATHDTSRGGDRAVLLKRLVVDSRRAKQTADPSSITDSRGRYDRGMRALHEVNLAAATVQGPTQLARVALDEIVRIFGAERAFLFLVNEDTGQLVPHLGRDSGQADIEHLTGYGSSLVERVHVSREPLVVAGSEHGAALGSQSAVVHGLRSIMVAPLLLKDRTVGVVYLDSRAAKGIFTPADVDLLTAVTTSVALSLETARAAQLEVTVQAARHERDTAELLRGAMSDLTASLDPNEVAYRLITAVAEALPDTKAYLLHREEDGVLTLAYPSSPEPADDRTGPSEYWRPVDLERQEVLAELLVAKSPVRGIRGKDRLPLPAQLPPETAAWLAIPLTARGMSRGLLVAATTGRQYTEAEVEVAAALAGQGIVALDNAMLFRQVEEAATQDGLTGLLNRRYFVDLGEHRMAAWRRDGRPVAAAMIDIDHFKRVNDTYGHGVGDEVIREIAHRLTATLRESDIVGRYGGEEFAVVLPETTAEDATIAADRLHTVISRDPVTTTVGALPITVSIGLAFPEKPNSELPDLLRAADEALYAAKRDGRDRVVVRTRE